MRGEIFGVFELSLNGFTEFAEFSDKIVVISMGGFKPATRPPLVWETGMLPQCRQDTWERDDL